jgi:nickel-dependent lactate racemase
VTDISVPQLAWHNPRDLTLSLPDSWHVGTFNMAGHDRPAMTDEQINQSITGLMGSPPIRELARGKKDVVITFDDMTRVTRVHRIVPYTRQQHQVYRGDRNARTAEQAGLHQETGGDNHRQVPGIQSQLPCKLRLCWDYQPRHGSVCQQGIYALRL